MIYRICTSSKSVIMYEDDIKKFLIELDASYISVRYPDDIEKMSLKFTQNETEEVVRKVDNIFKWLERQIK